MGEREIRGFGFTDGIQSIGGKTRNRLTFMRA